jgi:Cu-Zn family superoxide dismutase
MRRRCYFRPIAAAAFALSLATGCTLAKDAGSSPTPKSRADAFGLLYDATGAERGRIDVTRTTTGLSATVIARGLNAGSYGMHIHDSGLCEGPGFTSAGPHWNPGGRQHGRDNPAGAHAGDLPNMTVAAGEIGLVRFDIPGAALDGDGALIDSNGAALIIHAAADDMKTDPTGNSGARMLCGVISVLK